MEKFYQNVPHSQSFKEDSFVGLWINQQIWSDSKYMEFEQAIFKIWDKYPYPKDFDRNLVADLTTIMSHILIPSTWDRYKCSIDAMPNVAKDSHLGDRLERLRMLIKSMLQDEYFYQFDFYYDPFVDFELLSSEYLS